jgi:hypothetical protein
MPVRSLNTRILKGPGRAQVDTALRARSPRGSPPSIRSLCARATFGPAPGPGSHMDLPSVVRRSRLDFDLEKFPVRAVLLVYTVEELWVLP